MTTNADKAADLLRLHTAPELLRVVNVWDVITAQVVANAPGTTALATASHSIAASHGYTDGEQIPRDSVGTDRQSRSRAHRHLDQRGATPE